MARINLNCGCGWNFFVSDTVQGWQVNCPSCAEFVTIPGRKPKVGARAASPGQVARETTGQKKTLFILITTGSVLLIIVVVLLLLPSGGRPPEESQGEPPAPPAKKITTLADRQASIMDEHKRPAMAPMVGNTPTAPKPLSGAGSLAVAPPVVPPKRQMDQMVAFQNVAGLVSEWLRAKGRMDEYTALQLRMQEMEGKLYNISAELRQRGEPFLAPPHMQMGDRLASLAGQTFPSTQANEVAAAVEAFGRRFSTGQQEQIGALRGIDVIPVFAYFNETTPDAQDVVRLVTGGAGGELTGASFEIQTPLPESELKDLQARLGALPAGYRQLLGTAERQRLENMLRTGKGTEGDKESLRGRYLGALLPIFERDAAQIKAKALDLEAKAASITSTDVVHWKEGGKVEGVIEEDTPEHIKIKSRFGSVKRPKSEVAKIERGAGAATDFPPRFMKAKGKLDELLTLLAWCREKNISLQKELVACRVLELDPLNDKARPDAGLPRPAVPPAPELLTGGALVAKLEVVADEVNQKYPSFSDAIQEMRRRSVDYRQDAAVAAPAFSSIASYRIGNPLEFNPTTLEVAVAVQISNWWQILVPDERKEFLRYFALACAYERHKAGK